MFRKLYVVSVGYRTVPLSIGGILAVFLPKWYSSSIQAVRDTAKIMRYLYRNVITCQLITNMRD